EVILPTFVVKDDLQSLESFAQYRLRYTPPAQVPVAITTLKGKLRRALVSDFVKRNRSGVYQGDTRPAARHVERFHCVVNFPEFEGCLSFGKIHLRETEDDPVGLALVLRDLHCGIINILLNKKS